MTFKKLSIGDAFWCGGFLYEKTGPTRAVTVDSTATQGGIRVDFTPKARVYPDAE